MQSAHADSFAQRVEDLFQRAWELDAGARGTLLGAHCGADEGLRRAVEELLAAAAEAENLAIWQAPAIQDEARRTVAGSGEGDGALERYRLLEQIGEGGMGVVYKAIRADDTFWKLVAVKIVPWGMGNEATLRRFRQERQILAGLEHPHIARLLDGGATPDGRPFLVMEYVDGVPITRYLAEKKPPLRATLELFRTICSAVSYAHRNLAVHRDLKPGNILVTADGTPKLLDFGIARLQDGAAPATPTADGAMTPEYASPEQIRGAPITTASDIYSLGVILYEMLAGTRPYRCAGGALEMAQAICDQPPEPLRLPGRRRDRDLENIVLLALRKDADRRYASVDLFSEDIGRYLEGFPVHARADTRAYRASKFLKRHWLGVGVGALVAVLLIGLTAGMFVQWREARLRFDDVRALANSLIFGVYDSVRDLPGSLAARQRVAEMARVYLDRLAADRQPDDGLRLELATAYRKLGDIQGQPYKSSLGDTAGALESYRKARRLLENAGHRNQEALAGVYQLEGAILVREGRPGESRQLQLQAVALFEKLQRARPENREAVLQLSEAYVYLGQSEFIEAGQRPTAAGFEAALRTYLRASSTVEALTLRAPGDARVLHSLDTAQCYVAYALWKLGELTGNTEYYRRAVQCTRRALEAAQSAAAADGSKFSLQWAVSDAYGNHGHSLLLAGDRAGARGYQQKSLDGLERLAAEEPENQELGRAIADAHLELGRSGARADWRQAMAHCRTALAQYQQRVRSDPGNMENVGSAIEARDAMAAILLRNRDRAGAAELYRQNLALIQQVKYTGETEAREEALLRAAVQKIP